MLMSYWVRSYACEWPLPDCQHELATDLFSAEHARRQYWKSLASALVLHLFSLQRAANGSLPARIFDGRMSGFGPIRDRFSTPDRPFRRL
jgi:hypothetical protein